MVMMGRLKALENLIRPLGRVLVCFSGGLDSTLLLFLCARILGREFVTAFTVVSQASLDEEVEGCRDFAAHLDIPLVVMPIDIQGIKELVAGDIRRCYFCKKNIFSLARQEAQKRGAGVIVEGSIRDDADDYRPGFAAVKEFGIRSPLLEAGLGKEDVRSLSRQLNLRTWNKPATTCLLTRFPYGTIVTAEKLARVKSCETFLRSRGFSLCRVRYHNELARIEVAQAEIPRFYDPEVRDQVLSHFKKAGFLFVTLDMEGYRRGSLDQTKPEQ